MKLSVKQLHKFWVLYAACERENLPACSSRVDRDTFRHTLILRATGYISLRDVGPGSDFDKLMFETATAANNFTEAAYWATGNERRFVKMTAECARQIGEITGVPKPWGYIQGIFKQSNLPDSWEDIPINRLAAVFKMVDTYRRRLLSRDFGWSGAEAERPLAFNPDRRYLRNGPSLTWIDSFPHVTQRTA